MVQLSGEYGSSVAVKAREDVIQSENALGRVVGLPMMQSTSLLTGSNKNSSVGGVTLQHHADALGHNPQGNGSSPGKTYSNGSVVKNGFPGRTPSALPVPTGRTSSSSIPIRPQEYSRTGGVRVRRDRDVPAIGGGGGDRRDRRNDRDRDTKDKGDRWSYYGDPRVRSDQQFLKDRDDRRGPFRDDRNYKDVRDRRDDRRRPPESDRDRYPPSDRRDDRKPNRDSELEGGRDRGRYARRDREVNDRSDREVNDRSDRDYQESRDREVVSIKEERQESEGNEDGTPEDEDLENERRELSVNEEVTETRDRSLVEDREEIDHERDHVKREGDRYRDHDDYRRDRDRSNDIRRRREYDRERDRSYERERERDRDLGRDRDHQPLRREPVGEETGYDSDHSRASRATALSYSTRSLGRRPRPESVVSLASMGSHVSGRPPPAPRTHRGPSRGYEDAYGSREMYEQYQYYYQYYRDHPYYKEYYRQWMKQYGQAYPSHESFYDDRTSIHSGRSSVNDELKKSISSGELSGVPSVAGDSTSEAPQRLTPVQYGRPHINARFTAGGGLLFVLPKDPRDGEKAVVQIRDVQKMLCMDPALNRSVRQMKSYPGPLTLADTHKDVVVRYCEQQAVEAARNQGLSDGESVTLIWEYLALLVKQNGKLYGSDVAGLLLKGQDKVSQPQNLHSASDAPTEDVSEASPVEGSPQDEGIDLPTHSIPQLPSRDESSLLKKFTEYLCLGRKKEAVDYAMREGLWGHALALSFKMDSTTHTRVLAAFSNSIPRNDVLITLFQQLSGKRPEVTKSYAPQQWGCWRHHLAMMVSNPTGHSHRDKASIISLGDTLAARGQLHAAHFCYLVAEADWGCFSNKESKLVLIGSSHHLNFQAFATNEAIQCTEIYEFARALDTSNPVLETFQSYKLIYALRLAEFGFPSEALRYCEVIGQIVSKSPSSYQGDFLSQLYELASRLKYHDLHYQMYEGEIAEMPDPKWLSNLRTVVDDVKHQEAEQLAGQEYLSNNQGYSSTSVYQNTGATPDLHPQTAATSVADSYQQGYSVTDPSHQQGQGTPDPYQGHVSTVDTLDAGYRQHTPMYPGSSQTSAEGVATPLVSNDVSQSAENGSHGQENASPPTGNVPMMMQPQRQEDQSQYPSYGNNYWPGYSLQDQNASSGYMHPESAEASHSSLPASPEVSSEHRPNSSMSQPNSLSSYPAYPPYQPWEQPQQPRGDNSAPEQSQSRSPEPSDASHRTPEEEAYWAEMTGKKTSNDTADGSPKERQETEDEKKNRKDRDLDGLQDKNSGWSIGSLFGWKKSKQAVLPDDKNPTIVWNEEKKRWENKDGGEEVASPPPPPPKLSAVGPGAPPISLTRGGPRKSRYVNTEKDTSKQPSNGPSSMIPPPPLPGGPPILSGAPPIMPGGPPTPSNFMVPGPIPQPQERESSSPQQPQSLQNPTEQQNSPLPQAPLTSIPDSSLMRRSRYISESSIELEEDWPPANNEGTSNDGGEGPVPMMAPPGQPQFFNPNQFNPPTSPPNPSQTRRVGPGKRLYQGKR